MFGLSVPWDMRKKCIFGVFFEMFILTLFTGIFLFFPLIYVFKLLVIVSDVIFGLKGPFTIKLFLLKIQFLRLKGSIFHFSKTLSDITLVIIEISMGCDLSI